jgi:biopolymer transport protein ExbB
VLDLIAAVVFLMWLLVLEDAIHLRFLHPGLAARAVAEWRSRPERSSRRALAIRDLWISRIAESTEGHLPLIRTLMTLCPLLGLLGTVTGMIDVFDAMGQTGGSSVRPVAGGVSEALITTVAGLVGGLSGLLPATLLRRWSRREVRELGDHLRVDLR